MGNSEVGHLNIGAGRVIYMDVTRIDLMIASGEFFRNPVLLDAMQHARAHRLHLMGLCSDGGVHSLLTHLYALLEMAKREGVEQVFVHCFMDGRDTPPESGAGYHRAIAEGDAADRRRARSRPCPAATTPWIATSAGIASSAPSAPWCWATARKSTDPVAAVKRSYERGVTDEFIEPVTIVDDRNEPVGLIRDDDACIFFNYRADRGREMTMALTDPTLDKPSRSLAPEESALHHHDAVRQDASRFRSCCRASIPTTSWPT